MKELMRFGGGLALALIFSFACGVATGAVIHEYDSPSSIWRAAVGAGADSWSLVANLVLAAITLGALIYAIRGVTVAEKTLRTETTPLLMCDVEAKGRAPEAFPLAAVNPILSWGGIYVLVRPWRGVPTAWITLRLENVGRGLAELQSVQLIDYRVARATKWEFQHEWAVFIASGDSVRIRLLFQDPPGREWVQKAIREGHGLALFFAYVDAAGGQELTTRVTIAPLEGAPSVGTSDNYYVVGQAFIRPGR
jgi:hypothetical protein